MRLVTAVLRENREKLIAAQKMMTAAYPVLKRVFGKIRCS